jgi:hypothetical protein
MKYSNDILNKSNEVINQKNFEDTLYINKRK